MTVVSRCTLAKFESRQSLNTTEFSNISDNVSLFYFNLLHVIFALSLIRLIKLGLKCEYILQKLEYIVTVM
jgi:hypothetical protein